MNQIASRIRNKRRWGFFFEVWFRSISNSSFLPYLDMNTGAAALVLGVIVIEPLHVGRAALYLSGRLWCVLLVSAHFSRLLLLFVLTLVQQVRLLRYSIDRHRFTQQNLWKNDSARLKRKKRNGKMLIHEFRKNRAFAWPWMVLVRNGDDEHREGILKKSK